MTKRILIVEDEPLIAMMLEDFLEDSGFTTAGVADTVAGALATVRDAAFDAAILDVNLSGGEKSWPVARALAERDVPFVFATGGGDGSIIDEFEGRPQIAKPYSLDGVKDAIEGLVA